MIKTIAIVVVLLLVVAVTVVLLIAAGKPDSFEVKRAISIKAPPEKITALINDFRQWAAWSPWEKLDPALKRTFSGAPAGKGTIYEWDGNGKVGAGRMEILETAPARIVIKLDFIRPFEGHNQAIFTLVPTGDTTEVTWAMVGPTPFVSKVMQVFISMDAMIGKDFAAGLQSIKGLAEK